ncbi:non-structural maintenance of chromosomes element 4 homolog A-like [Paralichthys olivaceus]|uniref:non-structural maintenance of chromosomes element 4 homolog A-like n=1 Tax=Paralichthys olivaceus TaxID=8255 RepID=UPI0037522B8A
MKRARGGTEDDAAGSAGCRKKAGRPKSNLVLRRDIRSRYRDLINKMQENREDLQSPSNNQLTEALEQADKLFKVSHLREVTLDAQLLMMATDLGKEKASQMSAVCTAFDPIAMVEHLLSFMGLNGLEDEQNWGMVDYSLPQNAWHTLAGRAECCFKTAPSFHYMRGSFHAKLPPPKQKILQQTKASTKDSKKIMPTQLEKIEESHQETTEKAVERILGYLKSYYQDNAKTPIPYYEFVTDPDSFSQTVEKTFYTSFLIRDGLARIYLHDEMPCIAPVEEGEGKAEAGGSSSYNQCIISMNPKMWRELINVFDIKHAMIQPPNATHRIGEGPCHLFLPETKS